MDPYNNHSRNRRDQPNQPPRYDNNYYPGGPKPRATMPPPPDTRVRATMPPPNHNQPAADGQPVDLEGTMAHPNDPFWLRRRYTRNDSFPELRELDMQNQQNFQQQPQHSQRSQHSQSHSHSRRGQTQDHSRSRRAQDNSRSRRKHRHQQQAPRQSSKQGDRSYPKPPQGYQKPVASLQQAPNYQPHPQQNYHQQQRQHHQPMPQQRQHHQPIPQQRQHHKPHPPVPQFNSPPQFSQRPASRPTNSNRPRDVTQPTVRQTPQFTVPEGQQGFRLPPFNPNFKGPRPKSQFAPPSPAPPMHLPRSSHKKNYNTNPVNQGLKSGSSFTPIRKEPQPQPGFRHVPPMGGGGVPRRGRQVQEEIGGLDVLMSKTFAQKKNYSPPPIPPPSNSARRHHEDVPPIPPKMRSRKFDSRDYEDAI